MKHYWHHHRIWGSSFINDVPAKRRNIILIIVYCKNTLDVQYLAPSIL